MLCMPILPRESIARLCPFEYTRVDFFGHRLSSILLKSMTNLLYKKVWVCLFMCFTVRAIHLELVEDMSTAEFLHGLHRFIIRRGIPRQIFLYNAKQFN